jgi:hypothetical protein
MPRSLRLEAIITPQVRFGKRKSWIMLPIIAFVTESSSLSFIPVYAAMNQRWHESASYL